MLSRAMNTKPRSLRCIEEIKRSSIPLTEYDDIFIGCVEDMPMVSCGVCGPNQEDDRLRWMLKDVMRASVGVMGESSLGVTEKVVFLDGSCCVLKRFRTVCVKRKEFGRRVARLVAISQHCNYLVPMNAYLYSKRFKFVVYNYYPMGSLDDLLVGARELGHTPLNWKQRFKIIFQIARAIAFIHSQPPVANNMVMNVHGNLKSSNIMIDVDFNARLSNYGFTQFVREIPNIIQPKPSLSPTLSSPENIVREVLSQKSDIYHFGMIILDILGCPNALATQRVFEMKDEILNNELGFFEFPYERKESVQVFKVWDIGLACVHSLPHVRPTIDNVLLYLCKK